MEDVISWMVGDTKADTGLRGLIVKDKTGIRWRQISNIRLKKSFFFHEVTSEDLKLTERSNIRERKRFKGTRDNQHPVIPKKKYGFLFLEGLFVF